MYAALSYQCMRPQWTSVCGLKLLILYAVLSYLILLEHSMLKLLVYACVIAHPDAGTLNALNASDASNSSNASFLSNLSVLRNLSNASNAAGRRVMLGHGARRLYTTISYMCLSTYIYI